MFQGQITRRDELGTMGQVERNSMAELLAAGWAATTLAAYRRAWERLTRWRKALGVYEEGEPVSAVLCARYILALSSYCEENGLSKANVTITLAAIAWAHAMGGHKSPTEDTLVQGLRRGAAKKLGEARRQKAALTAEDVRDMYRNIRQGSTRDLSTITQIAIMREALLRFNDVEQAKFGDIVITESEMRIFIQQSKTARDRRDGQWALVLAPLDGEATPWCAHELTSRLVQRWEENWNALSRGRQDKWAREHPGCVTRDENGQWMLDINNMPIMCAVPDRWGLPVDKVASYKTFLKRFKQWIKQIGKDPTRYATHSCRRGGTTQLVQDGVAAQLVQQMGRWRSEKSMDSYIDWDTGIQTRVRKMREQIQERRARGEEVSVAEGIVVDPEEAEAIAMDILERTETQTTL